MLACQAEEMDMDQLSARKTYKYKLMPTPAQQRTLATVVWRCGAAASSPTLVCRSAQPPGNSAECGVSVRFAMQSAHLPAIKVVRPEYREINTQVVQDVLHRLDKAFAAFVRRVTAGEHPGYPRFQGRDRYTSCTYLQVGAHGGHGGAAVDGGMLSLSKIGRIPIRLHRPLQGTPKTVIISREADGWYACISCADVPSEPLPATGHETGIDVGLKVLLITADGEPCRQSAPLSPG
jgi:putative transposase